MNATPTALTVETSPVVISKFAGFTRQTGVNSGTTPAADFTALSTQTKAHADRLIQLATYENSLLNLLRTTSRVNLGTIFLLDYAFPCDANGKYPVGTSDASGGRYADGAVADHTADYQAAITAAIAQNSSLDLRGFANGIQVTDTLNWVPLAGKSEFSIDVYGPAVVQYHGPTGQGKIGGKAINNIVGMRGSAVTNIGHGIANGLRDIYVWDLDTAAGKNGGPNIDSTSQIDFQGCGALLGNGVNNCCYRYGHKSEAGADISNIKVSRSLIFGVQAGFPGGVPAGMTAFKVEGHNTLTNTVSNCLIAYVYYGITTKTQAVDMDKNQYGSYLDGNGNTHDGAGGLVVNDGTVWSHCIQDILYPSIQSLILTGTRHEDSQHWIDVPDNYVGGNITIDTPQVDNCAAHRSEGFKDGSILFCGGPYSIDIINPNIRNYQVYGDHLFILNSYSGVGANFRISLGFLSVGDTFIRRGNKVGGGDYTGAAGETPAGRIYLTGVKKIDQYGNPIADIVDRNGN